MLKKLIKFLFGFGAGVLLLVSLCLFVKPDDWLPPLVLIGWFLVVSTYLVVKATTVLKEMPTLREYSGELPGQLDTLISTKEGRPCELRNEGARLKLTIVASDEGTRLYKQFSAQQLPRRFFPLFSTEDGRLLCLEALGKEGMTRFSLVAPGTDAASPQAFPVANSVDELRKLLRYCPYPA